MVKGGGATGSNFPISFLSGLIASTFSLVTGAAYGGALTFNAQSLLPETPLLHIREATFALKLAVGDFRSHTTKTMAEWLANEEDGPAASGEFLRIVQ
ncbi:hypothetical protein MRB53_002331 [Persea americana]|uniref:Uncharacterized protein n=1 Tax=Persea americana TaxID=3435 RepID=A0ACC2MUW7_PERAE|nr:hypothetical protein MRB53_002331 [Persea americana]